MAPNKVFPISLPSGLKITKNFEKISATPINNKSKNLEMNNNLIFKVRKPEMTGKTTEVYVVHKKNNTAPLIESNLNNIQKSKIKNFVKHIEDIPIESKNAIKKIDTSTVNYKKSMSQLQAVARRNARERNRVKQVNNGFAILRQHIPNEIAQIFESSSSGRSCTKKLSKVETLRMAVEYIKSLESLLNLEVGKEELEEHHTMTASTKSINLNECNSLTKITVIKEEPSSLPFSNSEIYDQNIENINNLDEVSIYFDQNLPNVANVSGQQYIRIPGTNTYQLLENDENTQPLNSNFDYSILEFDSQMELIKTNPTVELVINTDILSTIPSEPILCGDNNNCNQLNTASIHIDQIQQSISCQQDQQSSVQNLNNKSNIQTQLYTNIALCNENLNFSNGIPFNPQNIIESDSSCQDHKSHFL